METDTFKVTRSEDTLYSATVTGLRSSVWNAIQFIATDSAPAANKCTLNVHLTYDATIPDNVPPVITLLSPAADTVIGVDSCIIRVRCTDDSGVASGEHECGQRHGPRGEGFRLCVHRND